MHLAQRGEPAVLEDFGKAHVRDLGRPVARQQDVGALQVKVHHPARAYVTTSSELSVV